jgi:hypothetical protein
MTRTSKTDTPDTEADIPDEAETGKVLAKRAFSDNELLSITTFEDALALAAEIYGQENLVRADQVLGNGFHILQKNEKHKLIGTTCLFLSWRFNESKYAEDPFVSALVVTKDGGKYILNDSGYGVRNTLWEYTETSGRSGGLVAVNGLNKYDGEHIDEHTGEVTPYTTYFIDTSV